MNMRLVLQLIEKYAICPDCGSDKIGNGQGAINNDEHSFTRSCKCGWSITSDSNGIETKIIRPFDIVAWGEGKMNVGCITGFDHTHYKINGGKRINKENCRLVCSRENRKDW